MGYTVCLEICNGVVTSDDFTDEMTEGFKLRYPYSDVTLSPTKSSTKVSHRYSIRKTIIYPPICRHSLPLFLLLLLSHPTSPLPNCSSPPKLQPHPSQLSTILNTSTQYPYVVTISVRGHNIRFL